ncbi:MAG TPA: phage portal protein [Acidimicrobiia bacterium]|nr:phage portal protein [Acidimicrobiia bacterium]
MTVMPWVLGARAGVRGGDGAIRFPPPSPMSPALVGPFVTDATTARQVPAVQRALQLYSGMCAQMPLDCYRGVEPLPRPRLLVRPDPLNARSWFVRVSVEDYLLNGNAVAIVTSRGADGWPVTVAWLPINYLSVLWIPGQPIPDYYFYGQRLDPADVIHVKRGADRWFGGVRGVGIVEECLGTLDRVAMEEVYESTTLAAAAVPSVALITPQATLTQDVADQAKADWMAKYGGPNRLPAILPSGTTVVPLSWSPSDTQLIEARRMSLTDVANCFNLDSYWLGAPVAGMTYRTAGPQYQQILRTSLEPLLADFEDVWSDAWLPRGQAVRFDRNQLLRDDLATTTTSMVALVAAGILTPAEARQYLASGSVTMPTSPFTLAAAADTPAAAAQEGAAA